MNRPDLAPDHPANRIPLDALSVGESKFAAKLMVEERCQILALRLVNMSIGAIAATFKIDRRTVTHICKDSSPRYKQIRDIKQSMGEQAFISKYVTEDLLVRVTAAATTPEAQETWAEHDQKPAAGTPNKQAHGKSGITPYKGPSHEHSHRIEVSWVEGKEGYPNGWYTLLLDTGTVDATEYLGDPEKGSHLTSLSALNYAKAYLDENY